MSNRTELNLLSADITPTCRANRGADGAFEEAVRRLKQVYDTQLARFDDETYAPELVLCIKIRRNVTP